MRNASLSARSTAWIALLAVGFGVGLGSAEAAPRKRPEPHGRDVTAPTITCPADITVDASAPSGTRVWFAVTATDDKDSRPVVTSSPAPGSLFPVGTTTVTATATDWKGNTSTCSFSVTVLAQDFPAAYAGTYAAYWSDADGYPFYEWVITIDAEGNVSGTGHQTNLFVVFDEWNVWAWPLPEGLSGEGTVSGTVGSDGVFDLTSSSTYWYWNYGTYDGSGDPLYVEGTTGFSGTTSGWLYSGGYLYFGPDPLASPSIWDSAVWYRQTP